MAPWMIERLQRDNQQQPAQIELRIEWAPLPVEPPPVEADNSTSLEDCIVDFTI